jgi:cytosine/adenosine deaminase-related metal-dependent hydrolase
MSRTVCIRNTAWVVGWSAERQRHEYLRDADVVFRGHTVTYVGRNYQGEADEMVDGRRLMAMPGLVNIHCHPTNQPVTRGIREEIANPALYMTARSITAPRSPMASCCKAASPRWSITPPACRTAGSI